MKTASVAGAAWLAWEETRRLAAAFERADARLRFVGGAVRDTLLGIEVTEADACTALLPEETLHLLKDAGIRAVPTGIDHGTVTAVIGRRGFEVTTLRADVACDGRHARVAYTDEFAEDAARRDFTINALYATPAGMVEDYVGGLADLRAQRLCFIGNAQARVVEDHLRILRYYRFGAQLGWKLQEESARAACRAHAAHIARLSGERIRREMLKMFAVPKLDDAAFSQMREDGVLPYCMGAPEEVRTAPLVALEASLRLPPDGLRRLAFALQKSASPLARLAWLKERWKLSNAQSDTLRLLLLPPTGLTHDTLPAMQKRLLRRVGKARFIDLVLLACARAEKHGMTLLTAPCCNWLRRGGLRSSRLTEKICWPAAFPPARP